MSDPLDAVPYAGEDHPMYCDPDGNPVSRRRMLDYYQADIASRTVGRDRVGAYEVSTVFLCLNHRIGPGPPLIYETVIFETAWLDDPRPLREKAKAHEPQTLSYCQRYATRAEAQAGHTDAVAYVQSFTKALRAFDEIAADLRTKAAPDAEAGA